LTRRFTPSILDHRLERGPSADQVALEARNSPSIIFKYYRELTTEEQSVKWFSITPKEGHCHADLRRVFQSFSMRFYTKIL